MPRRRTRLGCPSPRLSPTAPTGANPSTPVHDDIAVDHQEFLKEQLAEKDRQISKMHEQLERRDEQIMTMLERDRETNVLIKGLQGTINQTLGIEAPEARQDGDANSSTRSMFHPRSVSAEPADVNTNVDRGESEDAGEDV